MEKVKRLANALRLLPSIGDKTSERLAFAILKMSNNKALEIAEAIKDVKMNVKQCPICGLYTEKDKCDICLDEKRDKGLIMVLSYPKDVYVFENNRKLNYNGTYYILNGLIDSNTNINELNINGLIKRINSFEVKEVIIAVNPTFEGELTAKYLANEISKNNGKNKITISRLAYGLPAGGSIEFVDDFTILEAVNGRKKI